MTISIRSARGWRSYCGVTGVCCFAAPASGAELSDPPHHHDRAVCGGRPDRRDRASSSPRSMAQTLGQTDRHRKRGRRRRHHRAPRAPHARANDGYTHHHRATWARMRPRCRFIRSSPITRRTISSRSR